MARPDNDTARSPFAGCLIMIILASVAIFLISVSAYSLIQQNKQIDLFTVAEPMKITPLNIDGQEVALNDLHARLQQFRDTIVSSPDKDATLSLSATDLNWLLATMAPLADYKPFFFVDALRDGKIIAQHHRVLNGMPGSGKTRNLNAIATLRPILAERTLVFQVEALAVKDATVPAQFIAQIPPYRLGLEQQKDPVLGPVLTALTGMEVVGDQLVLRRKVGEISSSTVPNEKVDSALQRIIKVLISGFLIVVGLGLFLGMRMKAKREKAARE